MSIVRGITFGAWDLLHAGHVAFLRDCKNDCDELTVGLHINPKLERSNKNMPVETLLERQIKLLGCRYVDHIIVYETEEDLEQILRTLSFDIRFVGTDYLGKDITAKDLVEIFYVRRKHSFSSSALRERIKES